MIGWLIDLYVNNNHDLTLWFIDTDGRRLALTHPFPITFYAAGPFPRLRALWKMVRAQPIPAALARTERRDLFSGPLDVMAITVNQAGLQPRLFYQIKQRFPDLDYYNADLPITLRYAAATGAYPLAYCQVTASADGQLLAIEPLTDRWDVDQPNPPLRLLALEPDCDPSHAPPQSIYVHLPERRYAIPLHSPRHLLIRLAAVLTRVDPDLILTRFGDTWLLPYLLDLDAQSNLPPLPLNRDPTQKIDRRKEHSYFTYGQVVYRGEQCHLRGRWHIDRGNAMLFADYGLDGIFEQARVTGLPVQEMARKSPGAGITAMQMHTALQREVLVPYQKQQAERFKTAGDLLRADRGGLVYQPLIGLHTDVIEIDFVSMYPSIMVNFNISPETVGEASDAAVPEIGLPIDQSSEGLVPETLRPLLAKRIAIKQQLAVMSRRDCRYRALKARSDALKWLLVVCFGYLGYKNARFGRIESHEAVTAYGREALLQAKETAEKLGYTVMHMYVDGLWVRRQGVNRPAQVQPLLDGIRQATGLPIALEGIYKWVAFLPSRQDPRVPVPNRYFGVFQDGTLKMRGIATRRRDTSKWIAEVQEQLLRRLAAVPEGCALTSCLPDLIAILQKNLKRLDDGEVDLEKLLIKQKITRPVEAYKTLSPAARAARQLHAAGKERRPGQRIPFLFTRSSDGVHAWDLPVPPLPRSIDTDRYGELLLRAAHAIVEPLGVPEEELKRMVWGELKQKSFVLSTKS
ncbi:MAG: DNA polymerase domain-containing protein [Ardenticatenaceae bacterium]|nr:DNA polymerase domain-containing protein [Ardenticatenaceae bacterium]